MHPPPPRRRSYALIAYYFSSKMARLVILLGPVASALGGIAIGFAADQLLVHASGRLIYSFVDDGEDDGEDDDDDTVLVDEGAAEDKKDKPKNGTGPDAFPALVKSLKTAWRALRSLYNSRVACVLRIMLGVYLAPQLQPPYKDFYKYAHELADGLSQPSIMFKARLQNGREIIVDDYREAYWWLSKRTPTDARVMAWWDYGYQIAGIANRTTIADGNTWNHEHIATLGRVLSAPEEKAHRVARHLADYVLVWAGGGGDDLAKSPHMARIGNSVYHDICPGDPTCSQFGFYQGGIPTPMMEKCLLYKMVRYGEPGVPPLDPKRFTHAYSSKYGKIRIFKVMNVSKKSKEWVADPKNRVCDAPGSWYCTGQYPPALASLIAKRKPFRQLEDFNVGQDEASRKYNEEYHKRMRKQRGEGDTGDEEGYGDYGGDPSGGMGGMGEAMAQLGVAPLGCFDAEKHLGSDKVYAGGPMGAQLTQALAWAASSGKRYVAIAKSTASDGHVFGFNDAPKLDRAMGDPDEGCDAPCEDVDQFGCGCADGTCKMYDAKPGKGEDNARRWAVYAVPPEFAQMAAGKGGGGHPGQGRGRRKSKKGKKRKDEL
jgi:hypothetical protein